MKITILKSTVLGVLLLGGLITIHAQKYDGKGKPIETKTFALKGFSGVEASTAIQVEVRASDEEKVVVTSNAMPYVNVSVQGQELKISYKDNRGGLNNVDTNVVVYAKNINHYSVDSAAKIDIKDIFKNKQVKIDADSAGMISGAVNAEELNVHADSASKVKLSGKADKATLHADSTANIDGEKLIVENAKVTADSMAKVNLQVEKSLDAQADSYAKIRYHIRKGTSINLKANRNSGGKIDNY